MADEQIREIVELVRRVRHDANNPITAALGHTQLLMDEPAVLQNPEIAESLQTVERELRRLMGILQELSAVKGYLLKDGSGDTESTRVG